ncbi:MAG: RluA family pseudouridine synthase [Acidobacteria bacterium]|nr:RluA family pseudouridine synthase [Acidobacteriota bacterium]
MDQWFGLAVRPDENKVRLEEMLFDRFRLLSKLYLREVIKSEKCEVNGRPENRGRRLRTNDFVEITLDPLRQNSMVPEDIRLEIVFEDADLIVINKPTGMLSHPSHREKTGTVLNALSHHLNRHGQAAYIRPGLIHRLDKDTSGLLVAAKNTRAHARVGIQFEKKKVEKKYLALVEGTVVDDEGTITAPIGRYPDEKLWSVKPDGKRSETRFRVRERFADATLLEMEPVTGRTNQLRIHSADIGHPIVGDTQRGGREFARLCLHSYKIVFRHPTTGAAVTLEQPVEFGY